MTGPARFHFLNVERELAAAADWNNLHWPKLWLYNLHYFDDLNAGDAVERLVWHEALIDRWITENPPGWGNGWEPYPISLRAVNWIKWSLQGHTLTPPALGSLATQMRWLTKRLEWHLLGNHLFANAKALVFAGVFFVGDHAEQWLTLGLDILQSELREQILSDGGHFERSAMYHSIILEDVLDLVQLAVRYPGVLPRATVDEWRDLAGRMLHWLEGMTHPDSDIVLFNDAAFGIAPAPGALRSYSEALDIRSRRVMGDVVDWRPTGYVRVRQGDVTALLDVAPIGPDYLPGHAHADTLTFELSLFGSRWIVDTGCSTYANEPLRHFQRSTAAHNTVTVDGKDSSEVWSSFRVARRARVTSLEIRRGDNQTEVMAAHDGYRRLAGKVQHRRTWRIAPRRIDIIDQLEGRYTTAAVALLLHPSVRAVVRSPDEVQLARDDRTAALTVTGARARIEPATWHPRFGESLPTHRWIADFQQPTVTTTLTW